MAASTVLIVNPQSRGGWARRKWPRLEPVLREALGQLEVRFTQSEGDGRPLARAAAEAGARLIVAMGGDGTASEVASGILEHQDLSARGEPSVSFGYLPCATGGDLRRTLGTPDKIEDAARAIADSKGRFIDAGRIEYTGHDGKPARGYFVNVASAGMSGLVDHFANESGKKLGGTVTFFVASVRATLRYKNVAVRIRIDEQPARDERIMTLAVANGCYFGGGMRVAPDAQVDDGMLDVVCLGDLSKFETLGLSRTLYSGKHIGQPKVWQARGRTVRVELADPADKVLLDVDGETPGRLPATWTVLPQALHYRG